MTLIAALPGTFAAMGGGTQLWRRHDDGARHVLTSVESGVLQACARYATRDMHLAQLEAMGLPRAQGAPVFDALLARGLITDFARLLASRPQGDAAPMVPPAQVDPIQVIRSWHRPEGLARLLESIAADVAAGARPRRVVIVDDTRDAGFAAKTQALARRFAATHGNAVRYLGPAQCGDAVRALARAADVDPRALAPLLDPAEPSAVTGSRSWNWAQLLAAGGHLSILDDDTSFPLRLPDEASDRCDAADASEAMVRFFDEDAWRDAARVPGDPYEWLAGWLVPDAGASLRARGWRPDALPGREPREFLYLLHPTPVVGVVPGLYGGIALDTSAFQLYSNPPSLASLLRPPYDHARLESNRVWHGYWHGRFAAHAVYTPLLLDARAPLPFAGTWGRVDDTYFLMLLRAMSSEIAFAHVPAMLGHVDLAPRHRLANAMKPLVIDRNGWLASRFDAMRASLRGDDRWQRLATIGALCGERARDDDAGLADELVTFRHAMRGKLVSFLAAGLDALRDAPPAWRATVEQAIAANRAAMVDERPTAEDIAISRGALRQVAEASTIWPSAWDTARGIGDAWQRYTVDARA